MPDPIDLDALEVLAKAATPGPWIAVSAEILQALIAAARRGEAAEQSQHDFAEVIRWLWDERHDLGGPHRNGVHVSDFPSGLYDVFERALADRPSLPPNQDQAELLEASIEKNLGVLNKLEPHLGCAKCHGPLVEGDCPTCQLDRFEMGDDGKLRHRRSEDGER